MVASTQFHRLVTQVRSIRGEEVNVHADFACVEQVSQCFFWAIDLTAFDVEVSS
jgi:hypothetical protein